MCGILGFISAKSSDFPLQEAVQSLRHRGPDDSGTYTDSYISLGQTRLSIIDRLSGRQPIFNEDGSKCIIFNGEIYNYLELRKELQGKGHKFQTKSDTETILHSYEEWGPACLDRLRGMFAIAIWDKHDKTLFLARDRLGIKPLFFAEHHGDFYFASEMKAILVDNRLPRDMDESSLAAYFLLSYIPAPKTAYKRIRKLSPGHYLIWEQGQVRIHQYWDLSFAPDRQKGEQEFIQGVEEIFHDAVKMRLMSEVPLGAFLSGGIDSGTVVALMSRICQDPISTFCMGFGGETGAYLDERGYARMLADRYKSRHHEHEVQPEFTGLLETIVRAFDEPFADDSTVPSYFVCKLAKEKVTVALSGLGGDEAFAGYERYLGFRLRGLYNRLVPAPMGRVFNSLVQSLPERADGHYTINHMKRFSRSAALGDQAAYFGFLTILNPELQEKLFTQASRVNNYFPEWQNRFSSYFNSAGCENGLVSLNNCLYTDFKTYVPEDILAVTDRMSMQHSLEVRVPFLDHKLLEFCATIPPELKMKRLQKKYLLKKWTKDLLPPEVINHRKQGFVGPMTQWLKTDLQPMIRDTLSKENLAKHNLFNQDIVAKVIEEHTSGRENHDTLIWSLLIFQKWFDLYMS